MQTSQYRIYPVVPGSCVVSVNKYRALAVQTWFHSRIWILLLCDVHLYFNTATALHILCECSKTGKYCIAELEYWDNDGTGAN